MPRKKQEVKAEGAEQVTEKVARKPAISPEELASLETLGPTFGAGVAKVRLHVQDAENAKDTARTSMKSAKTALRKLRKAAQAVLDAAG